MMTKKQIIAELKKHQKIIAKSRDALNDICAEIDDFQDDCDMCLDDLHSCIDTLSQTVEPRRNI